MKWFLKIGKKKTNQIDNIKKSYFKFSIPADFWIFFFFFLTPCEDFACTSLLHLIVHHGRSFCSTDPCSNSPHISSNCCTTATLSGRKRTRKWSPEGRIVPPHSRIPPLSVGLPWAKGKIKTNRTLISGPRFSELSCRQKEPSPGRLPQIKASCSPLAASPIRITTTKPAETIIYSFWSGFWSYPTSSTMPPPTLLPPLLLFLAQPLQLSVSFTPKETGSCQLLCKGGCFEGAAAPELTFSFYFTPKCVVVWEKLLNFSQLSALTPAPRCECLSVNVTFTG